MINKTLFVLIIIFQMIIPNHLKAQCPGTWSNSPTLNYLCANGPFLKQDLGINNCPTSPQATHTFSLPIQNVELHFSAFGSSSSSGDSRMAIFLNGNLIDLNLTCAITLGCQSPAGTHSINSGCLVDATSGLDGGISGIIYLSAASFGLPTINSIGVAVSEPGPSGTIFEIGNCNNDNFNGLEDNATLCIGETLVLDVTTSNATYLWQDNTTNSTFNVTQQGSYWVQITVNNWCTRDTIIVDYNPLLFINLGNDTTLCEGESLMLDATTTTTTNVTYQWQDNSFKPTFTLFDEGIYWVEINNKCETVMDKISVEYEYCLPIECILELPTAFTPDNNGINDYFPSFTACVFIEYKLNIFNRWGTLIFESNNPSYYWNGTYNDAKSPVGSYYYTLTYQLKGEEKTNRNGTITLIR